MAAIIAALAAQEVSADGLVLPVYATEADLTPLAVAEIAEIGAPQRVSYAAGDTFETLVERVCGRKDQLYLDYLRSNVPPALREATTDADPQGGTRLTRAGEIELPHCLRLPGETRVGLQSVKTLRKGDVSPATRVLQEGLVKEGYLGQASGKYDEATVRAVRIFQDKAGLKVDGVAGAETWAKFSKVADGGKPAGWLDMVARHDTGVQWDTSRAPASTSPRAKPEIRHAVDIESLNEIFLSKGGAGAEDAAAEPASKSLRLTSSQSFGGLSGIPLRAGLGEEHARNAGARIAAFAKSIAVAPPGNDDFHLLDIVSLADAPECKVSADVAEYPIPLMKLIEVLGRNQERLDKSKWRSSTIAIADSGIFGVGTSPLSPELFAWKVDQGRDPDNEWSPTPKFSGNRTHGTLVASAALGTTKFRWALSLLDPPIRIMARSIVDPSSGVISLYQIGNAINVDSSIAQIINLSFRGSLGENTLLKSEMSGKMSGQLFVVAAGNERTTLGQSDHYPALFSKELQNVVTVAAVGPDGGLAKFSNHGGDYVNIAAPGCAVSVYSYETGVGGESGSFYDVPANGTSLSAPLVSFAAALLRRHPGEWAPRAIKDRLLASADVVDAQDLADAPDETNRKKLVDRARQVQHGRTLDIPAALAILDDVVTFSSGKGVASRRSFGKVVAPEVFKCGNRSLKLKDLRRIVPRFIDSEGKERFLIYFSDSATYRSEAFCNEDDWKDLEIRFQPVGTNDLDKLNIRDIRSIVFRK